jgi:hypothetical protein
MSLLAVAVLALAASIGPKLDVHPKGDVVVDLVKHKKLQVLKRLSLLSRY